jgi:hypothetical protein
MNEAYTRSVDREGSNGLIIINAFYGKLLSQIEEINNETDELINVSIPLQVLVKDHSLQILTESSKVSFWKCYEANFLILSNSRVIFKGFTIHVLVKLNVYLLNINLIMNFIKLLSMIMIL